MKDPYDYTRRAEKMTQAALKFNFLGNDALCDPIRDVAKLSKQIDFVSYILAGSAVVSAMQANGCLELPSIGYRGVAGTFKVFNSPEEANTPLHRSVVTALDPSLSHTLALFHLDRFAGDFKIVQCVYTNYIPLTLTGPVLDVRYRITPEGHTVLQMFRNWISDSGNCGGASWFDAPLTVPNRIETLAVGEVPSDLLKE